MTWMIENRKSLRGTLYIEVLPGHYSSKHWGSSSVFFSEAHFFYFEPTIIRHWPTYSHYYFSDINASAWIEIVSDFDAMKIMASETGRLSAIDKFLFTNRNKISDQPEAQTISELCASIDIFTVWVKRTLESHNTIAVLGI
jgi:hypothetical protein